MKKYMYNYICAVVILSFVYSPLTAQYSSSNQLLYAVYQKTQKAKDYSVNATVRLDMPFIKMLPVNAKIYFKQKNKFKVESKSIVVVPHQAFNQINTMLADTTRFTCIVQGTEVIGATTTTIVNVIPLVDNSDLILGKLWIDTKQNIVLKSNLTTKTNGTILTEYVYSTSTAYGLPDKMIFTVDIKKFKIPKVLSTDINNSSKRIDDTKGKEPKQGKIYVSLTNYQINKGIADSFFDK